MINNRLNSLSLEQELCFLMKHNPGLKDIPDFITNNLKVTLREYQKMAIASSRSTDSIIGSNIRHQLIDLASGAGKTDTASGLMLNAYHNGIRLMVICCHTSSILSKTKRNFTPGLDPNQYVFVKQIIIDNIDVPVRIITNVNDIDVNAMNILFITIQALHRMVSSNNPAQNKMCLEDLKKHKMLIICDESHHCNAYTTAMQKKAKAENKTWEQIVQVLLDINPGNLLIEISGSTDFNNTFINEKYNDKCIFHLTAKELRDKGYTKQAVIIEMDLKLVERTIYYAIIHIVESILYKKYDIIGRKPTLVMKSKSISDAEKYHAELLDTIIKYKVADIKKIKANCKNNIVIKNGFNPILSAFDILANNGVTFSKLLRLLKNTINPNTCILIHTKDGFATNDPKKQEIIDTFGYTSNPYNIISYVDQLTEGWNPITLHGIVVTNNSSDDNGDNGNKAGRHTITTVQLFARSNRPVPRLNDDGSIRYKRKFDNYKFADKEERFLETSFIILPHNHRMVRSYQQCMSDHGLTDNNNEEIILDFKESTKKTDLYRYGSILQNSKICCETEPLDRLPSTCTSMIHNISIMSGAIRGFVVTNEIEKNSVMGGSYRAFKVGNFEYNIIYSALKSVPGFRFDILKKKIPSLESINQFITDDRFLNSIQMNISSSEAILSNLSNQHKKDVLISLFNKLSALIPKKSRSYIGTKEFKPVRLNSIPTARTYSITPGANKERGRRQNDLDLVSWVAQGTCVGTDEEKKCNSALHGLGPEFKERYPDFMIIINDRHFVIRDYLQNGEKISPDFLLVFTDTKTTPPTQHQVHIEAKGSQLMAKDEWKQRCLLSLEHDAIMPPPTDEIQYKIWGMIFYNNEQTSAAMIEDLRIKFL